MFTALVYHKGLSVGIIMHKWPILHLVEGQREVNYQFNDFTILTQDSLEISVLSNLLFMPGHRDAQSAGPLTTIKNSPSLELKIKWLEGYKQAYRYLNKMEPNIIDLTDPSLCETFLKETIE